MLRLALGIRMFFKILFSPRFARALWAWLDDWKKPATPKTNAPAGPQRTDAVELLATLQREGRLVDFLQEKLDGYSDAQVGAAVRDIHRDCAKTLERVFGIAPLVEQQEGATVSLPGEVDPGAWKLTGNVAPGAESGRLCHHGWKISRHELPAWTGRDTSAWVVAPAEVEIG